MSTTPFRREGQLIDRRFEYILLLAFLLLMTGMAEVP
jgi:hypothetical protein